MRKVHVIVAMTAVVLAGAAPARAAGPPATVTMFSEAGDYIGGGQQQTFGIYSGDRVSATASSGSLGVSVSGGPYGESYGLEFDAPDGQALTPGVYTGAQRAPFHEAGRPGIEVSGDGRGCNEIAGSFEVRDLTYDATGAVQSAWVLYEQHCEGGVPALFGEVRIGTPAGASAAAAPAVVRWPARDLGGGGQAVPVWLAPATTVASVAVVGDAAADFPVRVDDCTGTSDVCDVWVRFVPTAAGVREAALRVTDAAGATEDVPLQGYAYGGTTGLTMTSDAGDYIGGGRPWSYGADSSYGVSGSRSGVHVSVDGANGDWWYLDFVPSDGDILAPGTYADATRYPFNGTGPGLDVEGNGRGCNELSGSFTVNELTFSGSALRTMSISFEQHCEKGTPALHGTMSFRAGDRTPPAPWMVDSDTPTPMSGGGQGAAVASSAAAPPQAVPVTPPAAAPAVGGAFSAPAADPLAARVASGVHQLTAGVRRLRRADAPKLQRLATRVAQDVKRYAATHPSAKLKRQAAALKSLRAALTRYRQGKRGAAADIRKAARRL